MPDAALCTVVKLSLLIKSAIDQVQLEWLNGTELALLLPLFSATITLSGRIASPNIKLLVGVATPLPIQINFSAIRRFQPYVIHLDISL